MSSWIAAIVDTRGRSDFWDVARKHHVSTELDAIPERVLIECEGDFEASTRLAEALSAELKTAAVGLLMQTGADVYGVRAFERGVLVRRLDYARDEGGWIGVAGTAQPWEAAMLFGGPDVLDDDISDADIARYEAARAAGDPGAVMELVRASGGGIHRVAAALGVDPARPAGRWRKPRWWQR